MEGNNEYFGRLIGSYKVGDIIKSGAFGSVYMAQHQLLSRTAAIKILHPNHRYSQQEVNQFFAEAEFLELLRHPHVLPIFDTNYVDDAPYMITEYAHGGTLGDMLVGHYQSKIPLEDALRILTQIGEGLEYTHQRGVIHRDLKPGNILFNKNHDAMLADFGIAILMHSARGERRASMVGTPTYMAPEQFRGIASAYSDQYALGCIAYELFTGRPPFTASTFASLKDQHVHHAPIPPTQRNRQIPPYIGQAILVALEKYPSNRHADIPTFISALQTNPVYQPRQVRSIPARVSQL